MSSMIEGFFVGLGSMVANKKVLALWLVLLSLATAQVGEKVYVERTAELAILETKVDGIVETLNRIDTTLQKNSDKLDILVRETTRVQVELEIHQKLTEKENKAVKGK